MAMVRVGVAVRVRVRARMLRVTVYTSVCATQDTPLGSILRSRIRCNATSSWRCEILPGPPASHDNTAARLAGRAVSGISWRSALTRFVSAASSRRY